MGPARRPRARDRGRDTTGASDRIAAQIAERDREVDALKARALEPSQHPQALKPEIERIVGDLRGLLCGSPEDGRRALTTLFGERALRVRPDQERGFVLAGEMLLAIAGAGDPPRPIASTTVPVEF